MKITWFSNAPWSATGYGTQTAQVVQRLKAAGCDVGIIANYGLAGAAQRWEDIPVYPGGFDAYSNDVAQAHHDVFTRGEPAWLITLYDVWPLDRAQFPARTASWVPIDHYPVPKEVADWCKSVRTVAMSRFGQQALLDAGVDAGYIPHAIDTQVFRPRDTTSKGTPTRKVLGVLDDAFLVVINAANQGKSPPRKGWGEMFQALGAWMPMHEDVHVYVHTDPHRISGIDLVALARACKIPEDRLHWGDAYAMTFGWIGQQDIAAIYSAADVLLSTSKGEGFGLPVLEAQACGTPVIVSDFTAQPELCGAGWKVEGQPDWDAAHGAFFFTPYIGGILTRLEDAYTARGDTTLREQAVAFAAQYDSNLVFSTYWLPFLADLEATLEPQVAVRPNRAERRRAKKARRAA